ncbi:MAG: response regulator [Acidobacteria bacterium]|nr:response regulator [Acidobacteriota bacterium]
MASTVVPLVLIVDDSRDAREMFADYLVLCGFRTAEATNGLEAIAQAEALAPDIILMDLSLPAMDGWEATRRIKADGRTRHIPVVAISGHAGQQALDAARAAGCAALVVKPVFPDEVVVELRKAIAARASDT